MFVVANSLCTAVMWKNRATFGFMLFPRLCCDIFANSPNVDAFVAKSEATVPFLSVRRQHL